jgi:hypothetical protein
VPNFTPDGPCISKLVRDVDLVDYEMVPDRAGEAKRQGQVGHAIGFHRHHRRPPSEASERRSGRSVGDRGLDPRVRPNEGFLGGFVVESPVRRKSLGDEGIERVRERSTGVLGADRTSLVDGDPLTVPVEPSGLIAVQRST